VVPGTARAMAKKVMPSRTMYNGVNREDVTARSDIEYLEAFYTQQRLHSSLGYVGPLSPTSNKSSEFLRSLTPLKRVKITFGELFLAGNRSMNPLLQRPNATTVIVPHVSYHAFAKNFLSFARYLLIGCPAQGLTRCSSKKLNLAGSL